VKKILCCVFALAAVAALTLLGIVIFAADEGKYRLLDDTSFERETAGKLAFVDFFADWCEPCVEFEPIFAEASRQVREGFFVKVDIDASKKTSEQFGVELIPYIVAVRDGKIVSEYRGDRTVENYTAWCREELKRHGN